MFDGTDGDAAAQAVDRLLEALRGEPFATAEGGSFQCSFSAGIAERAAPDEQLDSLVRRADAALYRAKAAGRNQVVVAGAT